MPTYEFKTPKGTFEIDSDKELSADQLRKYADRHDSDFGPGELDSLVSGEKALSPETKPSLSATLESALFPSARTIEGKGVGKSAARVGLGVLDVLGTPSRAVAKTRGMEMSDPDAYLLKPEVEKLKVDTTGEGERNSTYQKQRMAAMEKSGTAIPDFSWQAQPSAINANIELLGRTISDPLFWVSPLLKVLKLGGKGGNAAVGGLAEEASGVPQEALRAWGTKPGREAIQANAGKEAQIGRDLAQRVDNFDEFIPEKAIVDEALENMPPVKLDKTIRALKDSKVPATFQNAPPPRIEITPEYIEDLGKGMFKSTKQPIYTKVHPEEIKVTPTGEARQLSVIPTGDAANKKIDDLIDRLIAVSGEDPHTGALQPVPAKQLRGIRAAYDVEAEAAFNKDYRAPLENALIKARGQMAEGLRESAQASGRPEFVDAMAEYSRKLQLADELKKFLGGDPVTRKHRAEGFVKNLLNEGKTTQQQLLRDLEDVFGGDFMSRVQSAKWGKQLGPDGAPTLLPRQTTGRSGGIYEILKDVIKYGAFPVSSPKLAANVTLPATKAVADATEWAAGKVSPEMKSRLMGAAAAQSAGRAGGQDNGPALQDGIRQGLIRLGPVMSGN